MQTWPKRLIRILGVSSIAIEINPFTSEPLRLAVLFGVQAATHNVLISALAFGGITLIWETVCVISAADLLDKELSKKAIEHIRKAIGKVGFSKVMNAKTNLLTDLAITLVAGSPATVILKHGQDPNRTARQNRHLGYILSIGAAIVATIQGAAIVAGIWHPNLLDISVAVVIIGTALALPYFVKRYLSRIR